MSRQEVADLVNDYLYQRHNRRAGIDERYIGRLERGENRWPGEQNREALRAVLQAGKDSDLGFYIIRGGGVDADTSPNPRQQASDAAPRLHPLTALRYANGWTLQETADRLARRHLREQISATAIDEWEAWTASPPEAVQLALAQELDVPSSLAVALPWPHWLPIADQPPIAFDLTWDGTLRSLDQEVAAAMLDRRRFLALGPGVAAAFTEQWVHADLPRLTPALAGGRLDLATIDCLEQRLPSIRSLDASLGGARIRTAADAELRLVTDLLRSSRYDERSGRRLAAVAAELGRLAGYASFDSGFHSSAQRYWVAALHAAHSAGDRLVGANILKCMSLQQMDLNQPGEALSIARSALAAAKEAPARVVAMLSIRLARTCAATGDRASADRLIANAESAMSRADDITTPAWSRYFDEAEYCAQAAACYRLMKRPHKVEYWISQSLALQPSTRRRDRATYQIWRAENLIDLGDVESACTQAHSALSDLQASTSARNVRRLQRLRGSLDHHSSVAVVSELLDQIDSAEFS